MRSAACAGVPTPTWLCLQAHIVICTICTGCRRRCRKVFTFSATLPAALHVRCMAVTICSAACTGIAAPPTWLRLQACVVILTCGAWPCRGDSTFSAALLAAIHSQCMRRQPAILGAAHAGVPAPTWHRLQACVVILARVILPLGEEASIGTAFGALHV